MMMKADLSALLVIDIQDKFVPTIHGIDRVITNTRTLMQAAQRLAVPTLVSEQYRKGLGPTVPEIVEMMEGQVAIDKIHFSCMGDAGYALKFGELGRTQAIVSGIEAHVCVTQTTLDLIERDVRVFVVEDAVSSRTQANHRAGLERLRDAGASIVTTEMVLFEWLRQAATPEFKDVSKLIK